MELTDELIDAIAEKMYWNMELTGYSAKDYAEEIRKALREIEEERAKCAA